MGQKSEPEGFRIAVAAWRLAICNRSQEKGDLSWQKKRN
jgi:hypothetical protein